MVIYCACGVHNIPYADGPPHPPQIPPVSIDVASVSAISEYVYV